MEFLPLSLETYTYITVCGVDIILGKNVLKHYACTRESRAPPHTMTRKDVSFFYGE